MKLGFLGPEGTFSEQAALKIGSNCELIPFHTIWEVLYEVNSGKIDKGVVPIENSTEGMVNVTVDTMVFDMNLFIETQINLPIEQNIMTKKGCDPDSITKILSHPQGLAQCRYFLQKVFPTAEAISVNSTAEAGRTVAASSENLAAIGLERVAEIYNLDIVYKKIQDNNNNFTQFVVVTKEDTTSHKSGNKISVAFSTQNKPGKLSKVLNLFEIWDINMTRIVSRPIKEKNGEYIFFVDLEKDNSVSDLNDCLNMLKKKTTFFKNLGSYPVLDYRTNK